jgi:hypothetical protein
MYFTLAGGSSNVEQQAEEFRVEMGEYHASFGCRGSA